jgi:hypothetical protein
MKRRNLIFIIVAAVLLAGIGLTAAYLNQKGTLQVNLKVPDTEGLQIKLNDKAQPVTAKLQPSYLLRKGNYHMVVTKPGYTEFATDLDLENGQTTTVNVTMKRTAAAPTTGLPTNITSDLRVSGMAMQKVTYFYDKSWAFAEIQTDDGNTGLIVARYDDPSSTWKLAEGPGTIFTEDTLSRLPPQVGTYLRQNNYVSGGIGDE